MFRDKITFLLVFMWLFLCICMLARKRKHISNERKIKLENLRSSNLLFSPTVDNHKLQVCVVILVNSFRLQYHRWYHKLSNYCNAHNLLLFWTVNNNKRGVSRDSRVSQSKVLLCYVFNSRSLSLSARLWIWNSSFANEKNYFHAMLNFFYSVLETYEMEKN